METISITLPPELLKYLNKYVELKKGLLGFDRSTYVRELILKDLKKNKALKD